MYSSWFEDDLCGVWHGCQNRQKHVILLNPVPHGHGVVKVSGLTWFNIGSRFPSIASHEVAFPWYSYMMLYMYEAKCPSTIPSNVLI